MIMYSLTVEKYIEFQPVLVTVILLGLAVMIVEVVIDYVLCLFVPGWFSPFGLKSKPKRRSKKE